MLILVLYVLSIVVSNVVTASFAPFHLLWFVVPWGTFMVGFTFLLRDLLQEKVGRKNTYKAIIVAMILSALISFVLGDTLWIVFSSCIAFLLSETMDTEIYSRLKLSFEKRVIYSGIVGGLLDSVVFILIGLSPIGAGVLPWELVSMAIVGQFILKSAMQFIGVCGLMLFKHNNRIS